jgi:hypothetical protein
MSTRSNPKFTAGSQPDEPDESDDRHESDAPDTVSEQPFD